MTIEELKETNNDIYGWKHKHDHNVMALACAMEAKKSAETLLAYYRMHIKTKPNRLPEFIWVWLLNKIMYVSEFRKK